jgi:hypothetical protein
MPPRASAIASYRDQSEACTHKDRPAQAFPVLLSSVTGGQATFAKYRAAKIFRL